MRLNILLCDRFDGLLPAYIPSYESMFVRLFRSVGVTDFAVYAAMDGELPSVGDCGVIGGDDFYLITGSNRSAYDNDEWITGLAQWIREADSRRVPLVGICFGHQLIAHALGGRVERAAAGWGTGVREIRLTDVPGGSLRLMYNHHDQVTALPPGAHLLATSTFCPIEAFAVGRHIVTFQGHPEYVPEYNVHLIMDFAAEEPPEVRKAALRSIGNMQHDGQRVAQWIVKRFEQCRG